LSKPEAITATGLVPQIASAIPLRAAGFIVTLYGDAVVPRGSEVWMGTIIEICALVGISETLVRTAVSRLVAAGQLQGRRLGRRSYYQLTTNARTEFEQAAQLIYGPPDDVDWRFVYLPEDGAEARIAQLERQGYARLRPQLAVGPARGLVPEGVLAFDAAPSGAEALLPDFAAQHWDLSRHARAYAEIAGLFTPALSAARDLAGFEALALRLLLVHAWRQALLHDPRLPVNALPAAWPGHQARVLFAELYQSLSPAAEAYFASRIDDSAGAVMRHNLAAEMR